MHRSASVMDGAVTDSTQKHRRRRKLPSTISVATAALARKNTIAAAQGVNEDMSSQSVKDDICLQTAVRDSFHEVCSSNSASDSGILSPESVSRTENSVVSLDDIIICASQTLTSSSGERLKTCQECYTAYAERRCAQCHLILCLVCCEDIHRRQSFRGHLLTSIQSSSLIPTANSHDTFPSDHRSNELLHTAVAEQSPTSQMRETARQLRKLRDKWKEDAQCLIGATETMAAEKVLLRQEIHDHFEELRRTLNDRESLLYQGVDAKYAMRMQPLVSNQKRINTMTATSKKLIRQAKALMESNGAPVANTVEISPQKSPMVSRGCSPDNCQSNMCAGVSRAMDVDEMLNALDTELQRQRLHYSVCTPRITTLVEQTLECPISFHGHKETLIQCIESHGEIIWN